MSDLAKIILDPDKLVKARKRHKLSLEAAAGEVGLTRQGLSKVEKSGNTGGSVLLRLLKLYKIKPEDVESRAA